MSWTLCSPRGRPRAWPSARSRLPRSVCRQSRSPAGRCRSGRTARTAARTCEAWAWSASGRSWRSGASCSRQAFRALTRRETSPRSGAAAATRAPWRSRPSSARSAVSFIRTWTAFIPPIRACARRRGGSPPSPATRCSASPQTARRCSTTVRSRWRQGTA